MSHLSKFAKYVGRRAVESFLTIIVVLIVNFMLIHSAPGDPAVIMAGEYATPDVLEATRAKWGLDKPLTTQLLLYIAGVFKGDFGRSYQYHDDVMKIIMRRIPNTLVLILPIMAVGIPLGVLLGAYSARTYPSKKDTILQALSFTVYSMPTFWVGLILLQVFSIRLRWFPLLGGGLGAMRGSNALETLWNLIHHLALPFTSLVIVWTTPFFLRISRSSVLEVMKEDYIVALRCTGMKEGQIFYKHALRNAMLPSVTMMGLMVAAVFMGSVLVETVFSWPGLGLLMLDSIKGRDYPVLMGMFLIVSIVVTVTCLLTDILYAYLDPRVTYTE